MKIYYVLYICRYIYSNTNTYTVANKLRTIKIFELYTYCFLFGERHQCKNSHFKWDIKGAVITKIHVFCRKDSSGLSNYIKIT